MKLLPLLYLLLFSITCTAQSKRIAHWYLGHEAGIDFSSGAAVTDINGKLISIEGSATMSDVSGNLLLYTNGQQVWNRNHTVMANGSGLNGDVSSTQSSLIVPLPDNNNLYYIFTSAANQPLYYSIVDMRGDGGLGQVIIKNVPLFATGTEQLAGTLHCNATDYWIVGRQNLVNKLRFYAYQLSARGLQEPVITEFAAPGLIDSWVGTLTFSTNGRKLALSSAQNDTYIFDFNIQTGKLVIKEQLRKRANEFNYSNAFSPDGKKLYTTSWVGGGFNYLSQFDLTAADIVASRVDLDSADYRNGSPNGFGFIGQVRLAPDQKIYVCRWNQEKPYQVHPATFYSLDSLSAVHFPDLPGVSCTYQRNFLYLDHKPAMLGLPNFISNFTSPAPPQNTCVFDLSSLDFTFSGNCIGSTIQFSSKKQEGVMSFKWDFGDPASGINNESQELMPAHHYAQPGAYEAALIVFHNNGSDTIRKTVRTGIVTADLGKDTLVCGNTPFNLQPRASGHDTYLWKDGSGNATISISQTGIYWVEVSNSLSGCFHRDSINISFKPYPAFSLGNDIGACAGQLVTLTANVPGSSYTWNTGNTTNTQTINQGGLYWLEVALQGCVKRDTVQVVFNPYPVVDLGQAVTLCTGEKLVLSIPGSPDKITWQDNSTGSVYTVSKAGWYHATVTQKGCSTIDSIRVSYDSKPFFSLGPDVSFCEGQPITLKPTSGQEQVDYLWQDSSTQPEYTVTAPGLYELRLSNHCGSYTDYVEVKKGRCQLYMPTAFTPDGDKNNDVLKPIFDGQIASFSMAVYNRWGQKVFESGHLQKGWDGTFGGQLQPQGLYVWVIRYDTPQKKNNVLKGTVLLVL